MTPQAYAAAIGRALDANDGDTARHHIARFAAEYPAEFRAFLPVMQAEVLRRKQDGPIR